MNAAPEDDIKTAPRAFGLTRRECIILAIIGWLCGLLGWLFWTMVAWGQKGQDWMVFHSAVRAFLDGDLHRLYDGVWLTDVINQRYASWLKQPLSLHPWLYPPPFLLLLLPIGGLSFLTSYILFMAVTFTGMTLAVGRLTGQVRLACAALLLFPQTPFALLAGQNSYLTGGLMIAGLGLLRSNPLAAGALLGILCYKPQMVLMLPVALLAGQHWRVAAIAIVTGLVLSLASLAVFGLGLWRDWLQVMLYPSDTYAEWLLTGRQGGQSVYACALKLGASHGAANIAQYVGTLTAAIGVWLAFRRPLPANLRVAVVLTATLLAAPHVSSQDAVMLCAASLLLLHHGMTHRFLPGDLPAIAGIWVMELFDPPFLPVPGALTPLLLVLVLVRLIRRGPVQPTIIPVSK